MVQGAGGRRSDPAMGYGGRRHRALFFILRADVVRIERGASRFSFCVRGADGSFCGYNHRDIAGGDCDSKRGMARRIRHCGERGSVCYPAAPWSAALQIAGALTGFPLGASAGNVAIHHENICAACERFRSWER